MRLYLKCLICQKEFYTWTCRIKKGMGKYCSMECYGIAKVGYIPMNKGKVGLQIAWNKGKKIGPQSRETIKKRLARRPMSSLESKFESIIDKYNLPYKFVGNGKFFIGNINPDFVNVNGEKKAIEVYYRKHKELFRGNILSWQRNRQKVCKEYGWQLLFFDETQINEQMALNKLIGGN